MNVFSLDPINTSYNTPTLVRHIMSWINNENSWRRWYKLGKICAAAITHRSRSSKKIIIQLPSSNVQWSFQQICPIFFLISFHRFVAEERIGNITFTLEISFRLKRKAWKRFIWRLFLIKVRENGGKKKIERIC